MTDSDDGYKSHWACRLCLSEKPLRLCFCGNEVCNKTLLYTFNISDMIDHMIEKHDHKPPVGYLEAKLEAKEKLKFISKFNEKKLQVEKRRKKEKRRKDRKNRKRNR